MIGARVTCAALAAAVLALTVGPPAPARATATLVTASFVEDFDGPYGSAPDPERWVADLGPSAEHGWEEGSLETYTGRPDNIRLDGEGHLVIEARREGDQYTSGRLVTRDRLNFTFGTLTARMKLPTGQGIWPAFWMLGSNAGEVGWPDCGEIDIIELVNDPTVYNVAVHVPGADSVTSGEITDLSLDFHDYWLTRRPQSVTIGIDDTTLKTFTPDLLEPGRPWVLDGPMFVLINVAVGGTWPGPPDESTTFPATMLVDWLRFEPLN